MIKLIGLKRIIILGLFLGLNTLALAGYFAGIGPMREDAEMRLTTVSGQASELQRKISSIKQDMLSLKENMPKYQEMHDRGLFQEQDRFVISRTLEDLRKKANLSTFTFDIGVRQDVPNADAAGMDYRLVKSSIKIQRIESELDMDVYAFLQEIADSFPEHTSIQGFSIKRSKDINEATLQEIVAGKSVGFITTDLTFDWMTLVPKDASQPSAAGSGAAPAGFRGR